MKKLLLTALIGIMFSSNSLFAGNSNNALNETGININGVCKAISSSPDGYVYVLTRDKKLIRIDSDGTQTEIIVPLKKEIKSENDYFCDMVVDTKSAYFCAYSYSSIFVLDLNNPKELKTIKLSYDNKPLNPMTISKTKNGWSLKDFEFRTFKIDNSGNLCLQPKFSELILDNNGKPVIMEQPKVNPDGTTIFPNKVFDENNKEKWVAPTQQNQATSIEYLGYNSNRKLDFYLVSTSMGELDVETTVYAVDKNKEIVASKAIPSCSLDFIMRYCKLASDGSIIAIYASQDNPDEKAVLKRFEITNNEPSQKG